MERVVVLLKPDGVELELTPLVKRLLQSQDLQLVAECSIRLSKEVVVRWHPKTGNKAFADEYIAFLSSGNCCVMLWQGENARNIAKEIKGSARPPSGIRGLFTSSIVRNVMHTSETEEETLLDLSFFFPSHTTC
jgi:nucleoside-diphosphate kinase